MNQRLHSLWQLLLLAAFLVTNASAQGQAPGKREKKPVPAAVLNQIKKNKQKFDLEDEDLADLEISSESESRKSGIKHYYLKQRHQGIEVHGSVTTVSVDRNENVVAMGNRFHKQIGKKVKTRKPGLSAEAAVAAAARHLNTSLKEPLSVKERSGEANQEVLFSTGGISLEPIPARLVYQPMPDGSLRLAWEVSIYELDAQNWWNLRLDATTGELLDRDNMVVHCQFENNGPGGKFLHSDHRHSTVSPYLAAGAPAAAAGEYNVFSMPFESPSHGPRAIVNGSAADATASPRGWHHTPNGPLTTTRGNNVFAYEDPNNTNNFNTNYSPDGGAGLNFNFPVDFTKQPVTYVDAATTNLFYWNNITHDVWYQYGFDEASGNFQFDNFGRAGAAGDPVLAEAQDSRNIPTTRNNANFATPVDGFAPRMQMYLWSSPADPEMFRVETPAEIRGAYPATQATWARPLTPSPLNGRLVVAQGTGVNPQEGCGTIINSSEVAGKIAVVYRGSCPFTEKVEAAQQAGAIGVVVINNAPGAPIAMGGTPTIPITIPAVMVSDVTGASIRTRLDANVEVTVALKDEGKPEIDGDFDNGIIVHEYGHGISNRLTGGPAVANCLPTQVLVNNTVTVTEQMGEGWSDWFGLMMTMLPGDTRGKVRGIGTYASAQPTTGQGIRPAPYSTDFGVNNFTYAATNNPGLSAPHGVGFVWSTMLWDMTWDLIDKYGFDPDLYAGKGGNNIAMQLVIDGLKLQPCRPGFVDGRDAILLADRINYGGANQELIWKAFAKRGLGFSASQGESISRFDQVEAFDLPAAYMCTSPLALSAIPTSSVFTGGDAKVIYLGYGPQTVRLEARGDAGTSYTWSPAAGLSDTKVANPLFTPAAAGTYTFSVTAVNEDQCTKTESITIRVIDVRCGDNKKKDKILVCVNGVSECVAPSAVSNLLTKSKATLGNCGVAIAGADATARKSAGEEAGPEVVSAVEIYPNPFSSNATIRFTARESAYSTLKVYDVTGRLVDTLFEGSVEAGSSYTETFNASANTGGVYIYRFVNGNTVKSGKMMLVK
jgi:extracellular elastinolytic metalloproteinase